MSYRQDESSGQELQPRRTAHSAPGERRVVSILFCDVVGSTAMAEKMDAEEWAEIMDEAFRRMIAPIQRYDGLVARLMGDSVLAFFGAPVSHEDDPQRAVLAGLEILSEMAPFSEELKHDFGLDFKVRVGINTGPVVVTEIGTDFAGEYTAMGEAVNLAARMEQTAQPGTVQISQYTHRWIAPLFDFELLGNIDAKGVSEPLAAYRVLRLKQSPGRLRGIAGHAAPLIGREVELNQLKSAVQRLQLGRGQIVALIGEAGLGKSRLIEEMHMFWESENGSNGVWLESRGISYDEKLPYGLIRQIISKLCAVAPDDTQEEIRQKIIEKFDSIAQIQHADKEMLTRVVQVIFNGKLQDGQPVPTGEDLKRALGQGTRILLREGAASGSLVLVCDDLHWVDSASIDLLSNLLDLCEDAPLLFIGAFRPYRQSPGWRIKVEAETQCPHRYQQIELKPLSNSESDQLVSHLLEVADLPQPLRQKILSKVEGNPFFVEEVIRTLIDSGAVEWDEASNRWHSVTRVDDINIPDNLQALILARIDQLDRESRRTLQLASVIGRSFYVRVLKSISDNINHLDRQINTLERMELINEAALVPELEYIFRHELTRDAAYKSILRRERKKFHRRVAEAIETLYPQQIEEEAHRLAYHYDLAGDNQNALKYCTLAGDRAARLFAAAEAIQHYRRAISIARKIDIPGDVDTKFHPDIFGNTQTSRQPGSYDLSGDKTHPTGSGEVLIYLYRSLGRMQEVSTDFDGALETYRELEDLGNQRNDPAMVLAAIIPTATIFATPTTKFNPELSQDYSLRALELSRQLDDHSAQAKVLWNLMLMEHLGNQNSEQALEYGEKSIAIAREHQLQEELAYALHDISRVYMLSSRIDDSWRAANEANVLWRKQNNLPMLADNLGATGTNYLMVGDYDEAYATLSEGVKISRSIGNTWGLGYNLSLLGVVYFELGNFSEAIRIVEESQFFAKQANFAGGNIMNPIMLSMIYFVLGDIPKALNWLEYALEYTGKESAFFEYHSIWLAFKEFLTGNASAAFDTLKVGNPDGEIKLINNYFGPLIVLVNILVLYANQKYNELLEFSNQMHARMQEMGMHMFYPDILTYKARALIALGEGDEGKDILQSALNEARSINSRRSLFPIFANLIKLELQAGNVQVVSDLRSEGRLVVNYILDHLYEDQLKASFTGLPEVQLILEEGFISQV